MTADNERHFWLGYLAATVIASVVILAAAVAHGQEINLGPDKTVCVNSRMIPIPCADFLPAVPKWHTGSQEMDRAADICWRHLKHIPGWGNGDPQEWLPGWEKCDEIMRRADISERSAATEKENEDKAFIDGIAK